MNKIKVDKLKLHKTKILTLVLVPVLLIGLLTGCTPAELGLYDLQKEMSNLNVYETTGEVEIKLDQIPKEMQEEMGEKDLAMLQTLLKFSTLNYEMRVNVEDEFMDGSFYLKNKFTNGKEKLISYTIKGDNIYLKVDDLKIILERFSDNEEIKDFLAAVGDAKYIHINSQKDLETPLYGDGQIKKQRDISIKLLDGLVHEVYRDFELGMIEQKGDTYIVKLDANSLTNFLKPFLLYSLENSNKVGNFAKNFITNLNAEELKMFQLTPEMQTEAVKGIDELLTNISADKEEMKAQINQMDAFINPMIKETLGDSKIETKITKLAEGNYSSEQSIKIHIKDPANKDESFNMSLTEKATSKVIEPFEYSFPNKDLTSLELVAKKMPPKMNVSIDGNFYTLSKGLDTDFAEVEAKIINDRTYLPLRQIAEAFDEKVVWDETAKVAFIERGDKRTEITGTIIENTTFVQIRDFEKVGYGVKWNAKTQMVTIKKK
ncbi:Copper amine oxidase N-terminal domain-containing protein [Desulfonispora thiosulfatigenes DSM 11270]|uniref:Copper amine oxidase N-terminal domain-containing protein n=1 Tax=Desulfonispora thiosulfatigenes DSM 11270 TaxID=656914 RepID=A0A1W1UP80_DESTI|nr:copper amine oxidase N-terminal domain-containing protein [Desulfonispora thiosulfatigenes]SMB82902.1 Copper amine oxidase N-terminal domain-containing protein [Desulfonispora thiosulfatigenes DSM 11270]